MGESGEGSGGKGGSGVKGGGKWGMPTPLSTPSVLHLVGRQFTSGLKNTVVKIEIFLLNGNLIFFHFSKKTSLDILCELSAADHSHEISRLVVFEKLKKIICYNVCLSF